MKRAREDCDGEQPPPKVRRVARKDRLSQLSDELLVRILSFVTVPQLLVCQRLSKKFSRLAVDSELWKAAYYRRFVLPRASRIPGIKDASSYNQLHYSSRLSRWLDDGNLVKDGVKTHWRQQYRLRHNWAQGQCAISEVVVADRSPDPPLLVMMSSSTIFAADSMNGLRAWNTKHRELLATTSLTMDGTGTARLPISMAINSSGTVEPFEKVVVGFEDGSFALYALRRSPGEFRPMFTHPPSTNGAISALAFSSPYLLTMSEDQLLSVYVFADPGDESFVLQAPRLLYSLRSHSAWPPVSLSLRTNTTSMTAAIAYSLPTYLSGWTVGVQELRLSHEGDLLESRLATAADEYSFTLSAYRSASSPSTRPSSPFPNDAREASLSGTPSTSKPTSMSYSHPYLLVAHPDNTLSLYLVKSTASALSVSCGNRLWGHTSAISGAHVGMRGKAVSVSRLGDELRVWDLEGGVASAMTRRRFRTSDMSVRIQPSKPNNGSAEFEKSTTRNGTGLRLALAQPFDDSTVSRGWVGFDEHNVIVLKEQVEGRQALVVYDFT
ncbi:F-box domain-containing protein [Paraphoma chrysanthemicola]|uniref:F-box domain-containing protein n=1 Tax=Paraphoma chrysanthemicola TaxID=798071 RepID=A0A8K0W118_9PLEO|nr:F-box domain-containing protein [Paraphoma chrysanthemicola]